MAALKLRYDTARPELFAEHVHLVDGAGYFFFPAVTAPCGTKVALQVVFSGIEERLLLRGAVWSQPLAGGVWLELPHAKECLQRLAAGGTRVSDRLATDQLVLIEPRSLPGLLCRLADVSEGGARLAGCANDLGFEALELRVALPEAGPSGGQLEAYGRVAWARDGDVGVVWDRRDLASRAAVLRLLQTAIDEWETAPNSAHPPACRCKNSQHRALLHG
ncbi:MAG TPA: PilZ domain-containing protein [Myxococcales bacterium]|jgi:hypothetical protein